MNAFLDSVHTKLIQAAAHLRQMSANPPRLIGLPSCLLAWKYWSHHAQLQALFLCTVTESFSRIFGPLSGHAKFARRANSYRALQFPVLVGLLKYSCVFPHSLANYTDGFEPPNEMMSSAGYLLANSRCPSSEALQRDTRSPISWADGVSADLFWSVVLLR